MLVAISLDNWKRARHSPRVQAKAISYIASKVELVEAYSSEDDAVQPCLQYILEDCKFTPKLANHSTSTKIDKRFKTS